MTDDRLMSSGLAITASQDFDLKSITPSEGDVSSLWNSEKGLLYDHAPHRSNLALENSMDIGDDFTALGHCQAEGVQHHQALMLIRVYKYCDIITYYQTLIHGIDVRSLSFSQPSTVAVALS